jgi:hypothetical protein
MVVTNPDPSNSHSLPHTRPAELSVIPDQPEHSHVQHKGIWFMMDCICDGDPGDHRRAEKFLLPGEVTSLNTVANAPLTCTW